MTAATVYRNHIVDCCTDNDKYYKMNIQFDFEPFAVDVHFIWIMTKFCACAQNELATHAERTDDNEWEKKTSIQFAINEIKAQINWVWDVRRQLSEFSTKPFLFGRLMKKQNEWMIECQTTATQTQYIYFCNRPIDGFRFYWFYVSTLKFAWPHKCNVRLTTCRASGNCVRIPTVSSILRKRKLS